MNIRQWRSLGKRDLCSRVNEPNARGEPRARAGARHERRLLRVGSTALFGPATVPGPRKTVPDTFSYRSRPAH
jgi:hypothetical protein